MKSYLVAITPAFSVLPATSALAEAIPIDVKKTNGCGCCLNWMKYLEENGFAPIGEDMFGGLLVRLKLDSCVPQRMVSCYTAFIDGYAIEGHVPTSDIHRLLEERLADVDKARLAHHRLRNLAQITLPHKCLCSVVRDKVASVFIVESELALSIFTERLGI